MLKLGSEKIIGCGVKLIKYQYKKCGFGDLFLEFTDKTNLLM